MDRNLELKQQIANNIKELLNKRGITQVQLAEKTGISKSTISDYMRSKTLINPGNVEKVAMVLNVNKSDIDPTFKKNSNNADTIAAHLEGKDFTEEELQEILQYAEFVRNKRK